MRSQERLVLFGAMHCYCTRASISRIACVVPLRSAWSGVHLEKNIWHLRTMLRSFSMRSVTHHFPRASTAALDTVKPRYVMLCAIAAPLRELGKTR